MRIFGVTIRLEQSAAVGAVVVVVAAVGAVAVAVAVVAETIKQVNQF